MGLFDNLFKKKVDSPKQKNEKAAEYVNRALTYAENRHFADAISWLDEALAIDPNDADIWKLRGVYYQSFNNFSDAVASFDKAIAINPRDASLWTIRGGALGMMGRKTEALASFDKALDIDPSYQNARKLKDSLT